jgi:hypothetical protein
MSSVTTRLGFGLALLTITFLIGGGFRWDTLPYPPEARFSDAAISRYPDALYFRNSLLEHQTLPLWNPHLMGGQPFAAHPGTKVWYPLTWLLLIWEPAAHLNIMTGIHLWLAGMGMWFWARRSGLDLYPALLATLAYTLAPKLVAHAGAGHLDLLIAVAWLPWLLYGLHRLICDEATPINILMLAFIAAMIFMGAIQLTPFLYGLGGLYAASLLWETRRSKPPFSDSIYAVPTLGRLVVAGIFAIGFTAVQWIPLWQLREAVSRGELREQDAALFSLKAGQLLGLLIGDHGGNAENMVYVGISVVVLALLGIILNPRQNRLCWAVIVFAVAYALGENFIVWTGLVRLFPPLLWLRVPSRIWFLAALILPYLAGWGLQALMQVPPDSARARLTIVGLIGLGATCGLASLVMLRETEIATSALLGIFFLPLTALLIALVIFRKVEPRYFLPAFVIVVAADCLWIDRTLIEGRSGWLDKEPPELIAHLADTGARIYTPDYSIPQQDTAYWGISRFDGVDPFQIASFIDASIPATGVPREGYSTTVPAIVVLEDDPDSQVYQDAPMDARLLGEWGVEWVITAYEINVDGLELREQIDGRYYYENEFSWDKSVWLDWLNPNQFQLTGHVTAVTNQASWWDNANGIYSYTAFPIAGLILTVVSYLAGLLWMGYRYAGT